MRFAVAVRVEAPLTLVPKLTKRALRSKGVKLVGADWASMRAFCPRGCHVPPAEEGQR